MAKDSNKYIEFWESYLDDFLDIIKEGGTAVCGPEEGLHRGDGYPHPATGSARGRLRNLHVPGRGDRGWTSQGVV